MLLGFLIAALALQQLPREFLDRKVREGKEQTGTAVDEMTNGQLLRLTAMPSARLSQMQCTGYGIWLRNNGQPALPSDRLDKVHATLGLDAAKFGEMEEAVGLAFVVLYAEETEQTKSSSSADEFAAWRKRQDERCGGFFKAAADGSLVLRPLAPASIIDPQLNGCHAAYRAAARRSEGEEAASLNRMAERASALALEGKSGEALVQARSALNEEAAHAAAAPVLDAEPEVMQLALCVGRLKEQSAP